MARLTFIGAAGVVTGSKHLLETDAGCRVLLDCGMYQGLRELTERNWTPPPVAPQSLTAVLLSHAHLDHCGYLPALVQEGFAGPIYTTAASAEVAELVLRDAAHLQEDEAQRAQRHPDRGFHAKPLYTNADVDKVVPLFHTVAYGEQRTDISGCTFRYSDAGHILGSALMELFFDQHTLTFSGDLGRYGRPLLNDPSAVTQSDYVLCESTYGDRVHPQSDPQDDLCNVINSAQQRNGVLVIPSFAVGRTQEILYGIGQLQKAGRIQSTKIYVDSPMAVKANDIMERHPEAMRINLRQIFGAGDQFMGAQNATNVISGQDSIALNSIANNAIIIASSGMANGGRVLHHLRNRLPRPNDTICFVGFQSPGSIGQLLLSNHTTIRILGHDIAVKASIAHIDGFSAHADRNELLRWFSNFQDKPATYLVHGDPAAAASLAAAVHDRYGLDASPARQGEAVTI